MSSRWLADFITAMLDGPPDDTLLVGSDFVLPLAGEVCPGRAIAREITARDSAASGSEITLDQARMEYLVGTDPPGYPAPAGSPCPARRRPERV